MATAPTTYDRPFADDPWDWDASEWARHQAGVPSMPKVRWFRLCRRQPMEVERFPVEAAQMEAFLESVGVEQRWEPWGQGKVTRLYRTDGAAPLYPSTAEERRSHAHP